MEALDKEEYDYKVCQLVGDIAEHVTRIFNPIEVSTEAKAEKIRQSWHYLAKRFIDLLDD